MNRVSIREIKDRNDDYENTINALLCFISLTTWEGNQRRPNSYYSFGRRMTTSTSNVISPNQDITPDSVIQVLDDLGFIVEAKISLPADENLWGGILNQIKKYDDDLIGWWTQDEHINNHNVILLLHMSRSVSFKKYRAALIENGDYEPSDNVWGIEFVSSGQRQEYILFRTCWEANNMYNGNLSDRLEISVNVPIEKVKFSYGNIKFYDSKPEPEYLLSIIWQDILTPMKREVEFNKQLKCYPIETDIQTLTNELQKSYGSIALQRSCDIDRNEEREIEYPKGSWVKEALGVLIKLGFASKNDEDNYTIFFRELKLRGDRDLVDYFSKHRAKKEKEEEEDLQRRLFEDEGVNTETT